MNLGQIAVAHTSYGSRWSKERLANANQRYGISFVWVVAERNLRNGRKFRSCAFFFLSIYFLL